MHMTPKIRISSAVGSKELVKVKGFEFAESCSLPDADIDFTGYKPFRGATPGLFGIELKSISDFVSSVSNRRLTAFDGQLARLVTAYDRAFLLVYGEFSFTRGGEDLCTPSHIYAGYTKAKFNNVVRAIEAGGVLCDFVKDKFAAVNWIKETIDWHQNPAHKTFLSTQDRKTPPPENIEMLCAKGGYRLPVEVKKALRSKETQMFVNLACQLPGVSVVKAVRMMEKFGRVDMLMMATEGELQKIEGIGKTGARRIYQFLQRDVRKD